MHRPDGITQVLYQLLPQLLSVLIVLTQISDLGPTLQAQEPQGPAPALGAPSSYTGQGAPVSAQELQSLVAPIALYPDSLVAQILNGATFPDQVAVANYWLSQNKNLTGSALLQAVNGQSWDPSVKALTEFPSVLNNMAQNLSWTSQFGRGVSQPAIPSDAGDSDAPRTGEGGRESQVRFTDNRRAAIAANYRDPANESSGGLRPSIQSHCRVWNALHDSWIQHR